MKHIDPNKDIIVAVYESSHGIGAVILAICHASKSLNKAQASYSQFENELLALIFAVQKFQFHFWSSFYSADQLQAIYIDFWFQEKSTNN